MKKELQNKIAYTVFEELKKSTTPAEENHIIHSFAKVLSERKALDQSETILQTLSDLFDKENGIIKTTVIVHKRLTQKEIDSLKETLKKKYNAKDVHITEKVDERILGGMRVVVGEDVYDGTVKNKLVQLAHRLEKVSYI